MKELKTKELVSLAGIAVTTPFLVLAVLVSARVAAVADYDLLLIALALCGAVMSGINGFGRRTTRSYVHSDQSRKGSHSNVALNS